MKVKMQRRNDQDLMSSDKVKDLADAFLVLENQDEMISFLRDLMTIKEIEIFAERLEVAKMLMKNKTYKEIEKETGMSSATISRVKLWLDSGMNGYKKVLESLNHHHTDSLHRS